MQHSQDLLQGKGGGGRLQAALRQEDGERVVKTIVPQVVREERVENPGDDAVMAALVSSALRREADLVLARELGKDPSPKMGLEVVQDAGAVELVVQAALVLADGFKVHDGGLSGARTHHLDAPSAFGVSAPKTQNDALLPPSRQKRKDNSSKSTLFQDFHGAPNSYNGAGHCQGGTRPGVVTRAL